MELDEMKSLWEAMSEKLEKQKSLTDQLIEDMTQLKYDKAVNIYWNAEIIGFVVAYAMIGIILYFFKKLDTWYLMICGIVLISYFFLMPLFTMGGIRRMKNIALGKLSYKETLLRFARGKKRMMQAEQASIVASPVLFVASTGFFAKIVMGIDIFKIQWHWLTFVAMALVWVGTVFLNRWIFKSRRKHLLSVEEMIKKEN